MILFPFLDSSIDAIVKPDQTALWDPEEAIVVSLSRNIHVGVHLAVLHWYA